MMNPKATIEERLKEFQSMQLHGILRGVDCFFVGGVRLSANVLKYRVNHNHPDAMTGYLFSDHIHFSKNLTGNCAYVLTIQQI